MPPSDLRGKAELYGRDVKNTGKHISFVQVTSVRHLDNLENSL